MDVNTSDHVEPVHTSQTAQFVWVVLHQVDLSRPPTMMTTIFLLKDWKVVAGKRRALEGQQ